MHQIKITCTEVCADRGLVFLLVVQFTVVHRGERVWAGDVWGYREEETWAAGRQLLKLK